MNKPRRYGWNLLIALDQLVNALLAGDPDETLSSRMGRAVRDGRCRGCYWICRALHRLDPDHCQKSIEHDEGDDEVIGI
ncbi:hypothetical protein [Sedimenticola hydrogenitrophicus]|uniref:hypothetical protein n=1 Tax=Sedimenticola hydrogenitrophicus TaxID=2967975 RepID=UPI0023B16FDA|nr:hypothetical protein [Sedimenticola hydrogenitrophicus]